MSSCNNDTGVFPCPGAITTFSSSLIICISESRAVSCSAILCIIKGFSIEVNDGLFSMIFSGTVSRFSPSTGSISENLNLSLLDRPFEIEMSL